jgi:Protein of unknown function (DUF3108)
MNRCLDVRIILFIALLGFSSQVWGFAIPERLEFDVSYSGIPAGHAVQEVTQFGNDIHIVSTARSADWLKYFFKVDDRIESVLSAGIPPLFLGTPHLFRERISEGKTRYQKDAVFDRQKMEVVTRDLLGKSETTHKITSQTYDTLSSFYYLRTIGLQVGKSSFIELFDCKKIWNTEVQVLRREEIEIPLGRFRTVVIRPILQSEGIFARTGDLHIWLTDDERRIPVMMKSKVKIGSITATLVGGSYWPKKK